jgi:hypothetical protein
MSVIFNVIFVSRCSSTHHKLAMDALRHVRGEDAERWRRLFLKHHPSYLEGSKAPDDRFKDFKNHVLHVGDGEWGGAIKAVETWYDRFVHALRKQDWEEAAFSAGVLSHYYTDPIQPFHTGQSEAEGKVHRAAEWSIAKSYHELQNILEHDFDGYPNMELPTTPTWLADHVRNGARMAHQYYDTCIEHYDLAKGVRNPPAGLDQELKDILAQLIGFAAVGFARLLERGFDESQAQAPEVELVLDTIIAQCRRPVNWIVRQLKDVHERNIVMDIYREVQNTGKAIETLPPDDRAVRRLHAQEVRKIPLGELDAEPAKAAGTAHGTGEPPRSRSREAITRMARGSRFRFSRAPKVSPSAEVTAVPAPQTAGFHSSTATRVQSAAPPVQSTAAAHVASYQAAPRVSGGQASMASPPVIAANRDQELRRDVLSARAPVASPSTLSSTTIVTEPAPAVVPAFGPSDDRDSYRASESLPVLLDRDAARDSFARLRDSVDRRASGEVEPARFARTSPVETVVTQVQEDRPVATAWSSSNEADAGRLRLERERAERDRMDRERAERERSERDRMDRERRERDRLEAQQREQETRERMERDRLERDRIERERLARDQRERADGVRLAESSEPSSRVASPAARSARFYLETTSDIEQAPSIGGKTADRLRGVGLRTVRHLLDCQPEKTAAKINQRWITAEVIRQWQQQASLVCRIPDLRGHDAQILVGCGITDPDDLAQRSPVPLKAAVDAFCATTAGERILRGSAAPDDAEIREWIEAAGRSRGLQAA